MVAGVQVKVTRMEEEREEKKEFSIREEGVTCWNRSVDGGSLCGGGCKCRIGQ